MKNKLLKSFDSEFVITSVTLETGITVSDASIKKKFIKDLNRYIVSGDANINSKITAIGTDTTNTTVIVLIEGLMFWYDYTKDDLMHFINSGKKVIDILSHNSVIAVVTNDGEFYTVKVNKLTDEVVFSNADKSVFDTIIKINGEFTKEIEEM